MSVTLFMQEAEIPRFKAPNTRAIRLRHEGIRTPHEKGVDGVICSNRIISTENAAKLVASASFIYHASHSKADVN